MDEANWHCFANITFNPTSGEWNVVKKPVHKIFA
jgi:hypothetical protein